MPQAAFFLVFVPSISLVVYVLSLPISVLILFQRLGPIDFLTCSKTLLICIFAL